MIGLMSFMVLEFALLLIFGRAVFEEFVRSVATTFAPKSARVAVVTATSSSWMFRCVRLISALEWTSLLTCSLPLPESGEC